MSLWVVVALAAVVVTLLVLRSRGVGGKPVSAPPRRAGSRSEPAAPPKRAKPPSEGVDQFRGAMLFPQKDACEAIGKLRGRTFPDGRVPQVPVPGCDRESCGCQVHPVVGRRRGPRRISTDRRDDVRFKDDRRTGKDRREGVDAWKQTID